MSHKKNLQSILTKLKAWSEHSGNDELDNHLKELENEINVTSNATDDEGDGGGGNNPEPPNVP